MKKETKHQYAVGVDFGTNSVRALIVDITDGSELATTIWNYPGGENGILIDPDNPLVARQNPAVYIYGFIKTVRQAVTIAKKNGIKVDDIIGIGIDATSSTPMPVNKQGIPLAFLPEFENELAAQAWLWKDHSSWQEADRITELVHEDATGYLDNCGGKFSSEWFWAKILHCKVENPEVFKAAYSWVECSDFVPGYITGSLKPEILVRGICGAGHKALFHEYWGGPPSEQFFAKLDSDLVRYRKFFMRASTADRVAGLLTEEIARKTGLKSNTPVAVGSVDAHLGAVGAGVKPGRLVAVLGTSACEMTVYPFDSNIPNIPGLCGVVPGSIIPGMYGCEAGQPAVGDIFNWFVQLLSQGNNGSRKKGVDPHIWLTEEAGKLAPGANGLLALDWNNGNRSLLSDPLLTGLLIGQTLHTTAAEIYRALIEGTAFGALTIIKRLEEYGIPIKEVVCTGGIAEKNSLLMQIYADILNRPMKTSRSAQTCALGAAIFGAVAGGGYKTTEQAQKKMTGVKGKVYRPNKKAVSVYASLYELYRQLYAVFGGEKQSDLALIMHKLTAIREKARH